MTVVLAEATVQAEPAGPRAAAPEPTGPRRRVLKAGGVRLSGAPAPGAAPSAAELAHEAHQAELEAAGAEAFRAGIEHARAEASALQAAAAVRGAAALERLADLAADQQTAAVSAASRAVLAAALDVAEWVLRDELSTRRPRAAAPARRGRHPAAAPPAGSPSSVSGQDLESVTGWARSRPEADVRRRPRALPRRRPPGHRRGTGRRHGGGRAARRLRAARRRPRPRARGPGMTTAAPALRELLSSVSPVKVTGRISKVVGLEAECRGLRGALGEVVVISVGERRVPAQVVAVREDALLLAPYGDLEGVSPGAAVEPAGAGLRMRVGPDLAGRILDALGRPIDGGPALTGELVSLDSPVPHPLTRQRIRTPMPLGVRALDTGTPCGRGQRIGIFAGSGVGKSTLLGMMARGTSADVVVVGLVGERGREVREFLEDDLGEHGRERVVTVVATSDEPPLARLRAAYTATRVAEHFRDQGLDVLLLVDSLTRFAMARREIGLAAGEPPATRGYPPSVFAELPRLLERAGPAERGTITGLYTVLVEGDDMNDPVADHARSILDGHVVLSRRLASAGHFPTDRPARERLPARQQGHLPVPAGARGPAAAADERAAPRPASWSRSAPTCPAATPTSTRPCSAAPRSRPSCASRWTRSPTPTSAGPRWPARSGWTRRRWPHEPPRRRSCGSPSSPRPRPAHGSPRPAQALTAAVAEQDERRSALADAPGVQGTAAGLARTVQRRETLGEGVRVATRAAEQAREERGRTLAAWQETARRRDAMAGLVERQAQERQHLLERREQDLADDLSGARTARRSS